MNVKIFAKTCEDLAREQVYRLASLPAFNESKIRIMPDTHAGKGSVIGFTANLGDKVIPNVVGVDIGCGMLVANLGKIDVDLESLDKFIRTNIPSGMNVRENVGEDYDKYLAMLQCLNIYNAYEGGFDHIVKSVGTLGGGNHFIELDKDEDGNVYVVIHTGSRHLGVMVCKHYQKIAINNKCSTKEIKNEIAEAIKELKSKHKESEIEKTILEIKSKHEKDSIPNELCYIEGDDRLRYLHDMEICQEFAVVNRYKILKDILDHIGVTPIETFTTTHNYISFKDNIIRKGAISCYDGEKVIIPLNMRDGSIIAIGKGNEDWNYSGPHGAGRLMSRSKAKENISMDDFKKSMNGIYTTSVNENTIDESPMAYKNADEIIDCIKDTVDIINVIKPIYNYKCSDSEDI